VLEHLERLFLAIRNMLTATRSGGAIVLTGQGRMVLYPKGYFECKWRRINILGGTYVCALYCAVDGEVVDWLQGAFVFAVENGDFFGSGRIFPRDHGDLLSEHEWNSNELLQHMPPG
jgi:lipopolysaccharide transport system ATP-binding protein